MAGGYCDGLGEEHLDRFDILGDHTSEWMAVFADAARIGQRSHQSVAPVVENVNGYFERAMLPFIHEIKQCKEQLRQDQNFMGEADELIRAIENGILQHLPLQHVKITLNWRSVGQSVLDGVIHVACQLIH